MADTRKDQRAPVSLKVRFKSATVDEFIEHYSKDVSRGGIYIKSSNPMAVGTLLKFQFQLKDESALIRGVGRVVWTRGEVDATSDNPAGMGIKFIKMDNESRAMVERILEQNAPEPGHYVRGRAGATNAEATSSAPPPVDAGGGGKFFPDLPPAELPPPEDRTAVRHATQFLAAALTEGGTDEQATKEAQEQAGEAKRRQEEVEAQRRQEAERLRQEEAARLDAEAAAVAAGKGSLPSMIIDPSLEPRAGRPSEAARESEETPLPGPAVTFGKADADASGEPDTEPPPPGPQDEGGTQSTTSIPHVQLPRKSLVPWIAIALVAVIAAVVALRGGPEEKPLVEPLAEPSPAAKEEPAMVVPAPEPEPAVAAPSEQAPEDAQVAVAPEPAGIEAAKVSVEVVATPRGAEVWLGGEKRGESPLTVELPAGIESTVVVRAPGYVELSTALTPVADKKTAALKVKLKAMPFVVHVESTPPGATINVGGVKGTTPADLTLDKPPTGELSVTAKLDGYERALTRLAPDAFKESDGVMRAQLSLTLKAKATAASTEGEAAPASEPAKSSSKSSSSKKRAAASETPPGEAAAPIEPSRESAPVPTPAPEEPKPAPPEGLPTNPFGN